MTLRQFIVANRAELERIITRKCPNIGRLTIGEIRLWVVNDEGLYRWAQREGAKV